MELYSTNDKTNIVNLEKATLNSLPKDKGLYLPVNIPVLDTEFIESLEQFSLPEIAFRVSSALIGEEIPKKDLEQICYRAINFPAPLVRLDKNLYIQELFHGPSLAFKDFGARFMAELMSFFVRDTDKKLTILVATSGDTGGAVAAGFHNVPNIDVIILYPSGKVSPLQEKQLTTWGDNIQAIEWNGNFDDCQAVVKRAFLDDQLNSHYHLSSANSINISRLIPQTFYYFEAVKNLDINQDINVSVPSGNIGNISAATLARKMGLPLSNLISAHNSNDSVYEYYHDGVFNPKPSVATISNAMDVGNPSNFPRLQEMHGNIRDNLLSKTEAFTFTDKETSQSLLEIYERFQYISEPHAAVAYRGLQHSKRNKDGQNVFLGTAHPAKFKEIVEDILPVQIDLPEALASIEHRKKHAISLNNYDDFKDWMAGRL